MSMYIFTHTHAWCIMYSMHIYIYIHDIHTWQHDGDSLRFSEFPRISETVERKPYTSGRYYLGIANHFIRFPRMDARPFYWCGFREVFCSGWNLMQRFPQEFHSSCPVTPVPSEVGCCLSTNQYTLVTEAVFHSGQGTTPPVGSLGFTNPKAVDYRLISHSFWFFTVIYWCMSILHKARWSNYHSLSQLKCRWIISVVDLSLLKPGWQQGSHGREIKYSIKRTYYSSACLRTAQSNWTKNNEHV